MREEMNALQTDVSWTKRDTMLCLRNPTPWDSAVVVVVVGLGLGGIIVTPVAPLGTLDAYFGTRIYVYPNVATMVLVIHFSSGLDHDI